MRRTMLVFFVLVACIIGLNISLPSGVHLMIALKLTSLHRNDYGYNYSHVWYTHPALSKFLYRHSRPDSCDLEVFVDGYFLTYDDRYILENAKIAYLLNVLANEYNFAGGINKNNADRDFLKWSIAEVLSSGCDPNFIHGLAGKLPPLLYAVFSRQKDVVKLLLDAGANPDLKIDAPGSKVDGLSILELAYKIRDAAKTDKDREDLDEIINILSDDQRKAANPHHK
jgi:hypothetical protein